MADKNENLKKGKDTRFRSGEKATRENGRKGGIRSGEVRNLKSLLLKALDKGGYDKMVEVALREMENGNPKFWELIRDTVGEKPTEKIQANVTTYEESLKKVVDSDEY